MFEKKKDPEISPVVEAESLNEELYAALNGADSSEKRPSDSSGSADGESHRSSGSSHHRSSGSSHHRSSGSSHHDSSGSSHHHHHHHHHHSSQSRSEFWQPSDPNKTVRTELSESKIKNRSKKSFGRKTRGLTVLLRVLVVLFAIMAVLVLTFAAIRWSGGRSLSKGEIVSEMITIPDAIKQDVEVKDEGRTVIYKGEKYVYNEDNGSRIKISDLSYRENSEAELVARGPDIWKTFAITFGISTLILAAVLIKNSRKEN